MRKYGLIGKNISYSFSPTYFQNKFENENITNASYQLFDLNDISEIQSIFKDKELNGLNVTIPYKEKIIPFLDELSSAAKSIQAVNTVQFINGLKIGHNTDYIGFMESLRPLLKPQHNQALILGTGGAAKAIAYGLAQLKIPFQFVSRFPSKNQLNYDDLTSSIILQHKLIINTTPLGTFPNTNQAPNIPYNGISDEHLIMDLIYRPPITTFLQNAKYQGATLLNGHKMLMIQAEESWKIWQNSSSK